MEKTTSKASRQKAPAAQKSSHVIDLRSSAASPAAPSRVSKPKGEDAKKPAAKPVSPPESVVASEPEPAVEPQPSVTEPTAAALPTRHQFWPAFWRFLVLLVILAAIVVGGIYLYVHIYKS